MIAVTIIIGFLLWGVSMIVRLVGFGQWCRHHHKWMFRGHDCKFDPPIPYSELLGRIE